MSKCPNEDMLFEYLDAELPEDKTAEIKQHISKCSECSQLALTWSSFQDTLQQCSEEPVSKDFAAQVMKRITPLEKRSFWEALLDFSLYWQSQIIAATAALLLIIVQQSPALKGGSDTTAYNSPDASSTCALLSAEECSLEDLLGINGDIQ